jgi:hypothetical protein
MKQITLNIPDNKLKAFLEYIKSLEYVSVNEVAEEIPEWQRDQVKEREELINSGEMETRSWSSAKKDIFKKQ